MSPPVTFEHVLAAAERVSPLAHRTPVWRCRSLDERAGRSVFLKCENFQRGGAFKFRGAVNTLAQLTRDQTARGVVTHSSGNHAQALALAASLRGIKATVVMPTGAAAVKREATEGYGARIVPCEPTLEARQRTAAEIVERTGATLVHPYDDARIVAGQGTVALELAEQVPDLDLILAPVGGGGLLSGTAVVCAGLSRPVRVIGCEPAEADDAHRSLASGVRVTEQTPRTVADGLRTLLGQIPFALLRRHGVEILRVSETEIVEAMRFVWERVKLVIEPSSAVAVAPLLFPEADPQRLELLRGRRVGVILSGGNVDARAWFQTLKI